MDYLSVLSGISLKEGASFVILSVGIIMILRGDLVPKNLMSERIIDKDSVIDSQEETIKLLVETNNKLLAESAITVKLLATLNATIGGEKDVVTREKDNT